MRNENLSVNWAQPLAQDFVTVHKCPDNIRTDGPGIVKLPSDRLLCMFVYALYRGTAKTVKKESTLKTLVYRSDDQGESWKQIGSLEIEDGLPFIHKGRLYYLCNHLGRKNIIITCSDDEGESWARPVVLFEGSFWNTTTGYAVANSKLYWTFDSSTERGRDSVVVAGDLSRDLMDRDSWRISPNLSYPGTPENLRRGIHEPYSDHWLEGNVVNVEGNIRVILRTRIDAHATTSICAVCDVEDDGQNLTYNFTQFHPMPGAQNKFHIIYDDISGLYWALANLVTDSQDFKQRGKKWEQKGYIGSGSFHHATGNERRILVLLYSLDALNWFQAGCVAMWPSPLQAFNYASMIADGDDLLIVSRTSKNGKNNHDNDLVTFHRLPDFRSLALNLFARLSE